MIPQFLILIASMPLGQGQPSKPTEAKKETFTEHRILYVGRGGRDIQPVEDRPALTLSLTAAGEILGDGKYVADDEMLEKWVSEHCAGHPRVDIVVLIPEPTKTTIRTMEKGIDRLKKHVPKKTVATFYVSDNE